jgi:hypothetical protein
LVANNDWLENRAWSVVFELNEELAQLALRALSALNAVSDALAQLADRADSELVAHKL